MRNDGSEVLDANNNMHVFLHMKILKILAVDGDCRLERLLEHF